MFREERAAGEMPSEVKKMANGASIIMNEENEMVNERAKESRCAHCEFGEGRTRERTEKEFRSLMNRLKRVEGQIRGIEGMLEKDAYCPDILIQVSSVTSALNSFNKELLASHVRTCVANDIRAGNDETIDELVEVLKKLMK